MRLILFLKVIEQLSKLCCVFATDIDDVLVVQHDQWLVRLIHVFNILFLEIDDLVQVEWDGVVGDSERVVQNDCLVEVIEDVNVLHEQLIKSDLSKARNISFTHHSCSEIDLPDRGREVFFELSLVALLFFIIEVHTWVWDWINSLIANRASEHELRTNNFIFFVKHGVDHDRTSIERLGGN